MWGRWQAAWRDVRIVDAQNRLRAVVNLFDNDLSLPENRASLKQLFLEAARAADSDKDGLPDDWEWHYFGSLAARPGDDPDRDGATNFSEFAFGTGPLDALAKSSMRPSLARQDQRAVLSVAFRKRAGAYLNYVVEGSPDLVRWTPLSAVPERPFQNLFDGTGTASGSFALAPQPGEGRMGFLRVRAVVRRPN